jgi:preprotein translocase subunit SecG
LFYKKMNGMSIAIRTRVALGLVAAVLLATRAGADVRLSLNQGEVNLLARQATLQEILDEWTKVAGTTFVALDQLPSEQIDVDLRGVSEREALDLLLRWASGYVIAPRAAGAPIQSQFGSVVIVGKSSAPGRTVVASRPPVGPTQTASEAAEFRSEPAAGIADPDVDATGASSRSGATTAVGIVQPPPAPGPGWVNGVPPGFAPGEPIGDLRSRPDLMPAWLKDSGVPPLSDRVTAPPGAATPGAVAPVQLRKPDVGASLSPASPPPPAAPPAN